MEIDKLTCLHKNYKKHGKDRKGNQRYICLDCKKSWTDRRRDNRLDKTVFKYSKEMLLDWLDGHSYRTISRNYKLSTYYVKLFISFIVREIMKYNDYVRSHVDRIEVKHIGMDGGYISTSHGKVCFMIAVDLDSNTIISFAEKEETTADLIEFIGEIKNNFPNVETITTDLKRTYDLAINHINEQLSCNEVKIQHVFCLVHLFMSYNKQGWNAGLQIGRRKYRIEETKLDFESNLRQLIFSSFNDEDTFNKQLHYMRTKLVLKEAWVRILNDVEKKKKHMILNNIDRKYKTNNLSESWWNLLKTKFKTARSLGYENVNNWMNLFVLRYHFNHLDYNGKVIDKGKTFQDSNLLTFEDVVNACEPCFRAIVEQHNFARSLIFAGICN